MLQRCLVLTPKRVEEVRGSIAWEKVFRAGLFHPQSHGHRNLLIGHVGRCLRAEAARDTVGGGEVSDLSGREKVPAPVLTSPIVVVRVD